VAEGVTFHESDQLQGRLGVMQEKKRASIMGEIDVIALDQM